MGSQQRSSHHSVASSSLPSTCGTNSLRIYQEIFSLVTLVSLLNQAKKNHEDCHAHTASPEAMVLEQVRMFAEEILRDDANSDKDSDGDNIEVVSNCDDIQVVSPSPISNTMAVSSA